MNFDEMGVGSAMNIEQNPSGSSQTNLSNDIAVNVNGDMPNVYSDVLHEIVEFRHEMEDEYVSDDLESLSGRKCNLKPTEEQPPPAGEQPQAASSVSVQAASSVPVQAAAGVPIQVTETSRDANTVAGNSQSAQKSDKKRQRKGANPRHLIPKSVQKERLQKKCINKGQPQIQNTQTPTEIKLNLLDALNAKLNNTMTELNPLIGSPPASHIQPIQNLQKVMGLAEQVISSEQPDWNAVTKEIPIPPDLLHTYNTVQQVTDFARALTAGEGGKSYEDGCTNPTEPFIPPKVFVPQMV
ncbi:basic region leucine zipper [Sesbania bispinosa]|nr:basic region leucine zipper [Sesbania bispinosa]